MNSISRLELLIKEIEACAINAKRDPRSVKLVIVTKGQTLESIKMLYEGGYFDFGENRVQEAMTKIEQLPHDIHWHFIGKLQKNKVNKAIPHFSLIHSVDTVELAEKIANVSEERQVRTALLLEVNTSGEATKSGLSPEDWEKAFPTVLKLQHVDIKGLMTMAPLTEDATLVRSYFATLRQMKERLSTLSSPLEHLSMGMSHDFRIAIEEGATLLRIGTKIFDGTI